MWGLETVGDVKQCREICLSKGFAYAAVQNNSRCTCGVSYGRYGKAVPFACDCKNNNAIYKAGKYNVVMKSQEQYQGLFI